MELKLILSWILEMKFTIYGFVIVDFVSLKVFNFVLLNIKKLTVNGIKIKSI